ncbi:hypothetical protein SH528x_003261 [Novipirellula sp. SH528]|uniref:hypothetical protein n=1 Tax=Novipirellula sp. SH528 TaxID=3454466 RepID=UPI003FA0E547
MKIWQFLLLASIALLSLLPKTMDIESLSTEVKSAANIAKTETLHAVHGLPFELKSTEYTEFDSVSASPQSVPQLDAGSKLELGIPSRLPMFALTTSLPLSTVWHSKPNASYDEHLLDVACLSELRLLPHWTVAQASRLLHSPASLHSLRIRLQV